MKQNSICCFIKMDLNAQRIDFRVWWSCSWLIIWAYIFSFWQEYLFNYKRLIELKMLKRLTLTIHVPKGKPSGALDIDSKDVRKYYNILQQLQKMKTDKSTRDDDQSSRKNTRNNQRPTCGKGLSSSTTIAKEVQINCKNVSSIIDIKDILIWCKNLFKCLFVPEVDLQVKTENDKINDKPCVFTHIRCS